MAKVVFRRRELFAPGFTSWWIVALLIDDFFYLGEVCVNATFFNADQSLGAWAGVLTVGQLIQLLSQGLDLVP